MTNGKYCGINLIALEETVNRVYLGSGMQQDHAVLRSGLSFICDYMYTDRPGGIADNFGHELNEEAILSSRMFSALTQPCMVICHTH